MKDGHRFFICKHCGNIIGMIHNSGVPIQCCGEPMHELVANTSEGAAEKHLPVVEKEGKMIRVKVGEVYHPMTEEHGITWVYLQTENGGQRKILPVNQDPVVSFALTEGEKPVAVYAYCNLHGLWKTVL